MRIEIMNKLVAVVVSILAVSVGWAQSASAQQAMDKAAPVEFFACNWQKGKGMSDLKKVAKKFNQWADKNDMQYSAWILTPQFTAADLGFQVGWLGGWPDGNAFGKGQDKWMASGGDLGDEFNAVIDCISHETASSAVVNAPDGPPGNGVVMFSQCTLQPGKMPAEALEGHRKVGAMMKGMGSPASSWLFFPGMGSGDIDFHYWSVIGFQNYTDLGAATELYINGGGWQKAMGILSSLTRCQSPAVFDAHAVRQGGNS
jgi:hypothetical protein